MSDNYSYIADGLDGIYVIDVSNPHNPQLVGYYDSPGEARVVAVERIIYT
ncbi:hypothetical protein DRN74_05330 [Candidatus Micrarchaeota archaeon]|nr:MAG: hypothetical protein DRN74_05330 [Candidatus Micrarchaeota archaeon]